MLLIIKWFQIRLQNTITFQIWIKWIRISWILQLILLKLLELIIILLIQTFLDILVVVHFWSFIAVCLVYYWILKKLNIFSCNIHCIHPKRRTFFFFIWWNFCVIKSKKWWLITIIDRHRAATLSDIWTLTQLILNIHIILLQTRSHYSYWLFPLLIQLPPLPSFINHLSLPSCIIILIFRFS